MWYLKSLWKERKKWRRHTDFQLSLSKCDLVIFSHNLVSNFKDDCERKQMHQIWGRHFYFYFDREVQDIESDLNPD